MTALNVPSHAEVSASNQGIFDSLKQKMGKVPNLYATMAYSENALGSYLALQNAKSSITNQAREVINLIVSQVNNCDYCLAAHTALGKRAGFSDAQILEIRSGQASFDNKLDALAKFIKAVAERRGHISDVEREAFLNAGWTKENLVDAIVLVGDKTITNYLHAVTQVPVDFPPAQKLPE